VHCPRLAAAALVALLVSSPAAAQKEKDYEPHVGQAGKDVIWVPTPDEVVDRMLRMAQVTANDYVVDLGAGDGKIAIAAARRYGARALGIEYNGDMARHAQRNVEKAGVAGKAKIVQGDIFVSDFSQATVVTMYLLPALNLKLRPQLLAMRPGTRVVSHSFSMDDWEADEISSLDGRRAYFWLVPAQVAGNWTLELSGGGLAERMELTLEQRYL
jgi:SAM-dependent methyltransferase